MALLFQHFWVAFIVVTCLNGAIWWKRSRSHREQDPTLTEGYRTLIRGFVTWGNIPWVVMGAGILFGGVPSVFAYFDPKSPNLFVTAWFGSLFLVWGAGTYWLFARGGAEMLARHPGIIQPELAVPSRLKVIWLLALAGGIGALTAMYLADFRPPTF